MTTECGPADADIPWDLAHRKRGNTVDTTESSAPHAHSSTEDHDDTVEAHYASLERLRPHACIGGWVFRLHRRARRGEGSVLPVPPLCG